VAIVVGGGIVLQEFLYRSYSRFAGEGMKTHLMIATFVFTYGLLLTMTLKI
jgi:hypothetical protein